MFGNDTRGDAQRYFIVSEYRIFVGQELLKMKILLDISDNKTAFFMELLKSFKFVKKATPLSNAKADLMQDIREAVEELNLVKNGKLKARNAEDIIHEL